ncbi:MAG TPA: septum formation initiator family protein [Candidatus Acidoferrales bacterium]|jgi:cell division protein FtsB|nr:septum formation initiator family protein [Candidatus Acidoferrales bacterium]
MAIQTINGSEGGHLPLSARLSEFWRRNWSLLLVAALALLLLQDIFGTHGLIAMRRSEKEAKQVQKEISQLDDENRKLEEKVQGLKSDPAAIERIAREEMGLARPGEYIFKLPPKSPTADAPAADAPAAKP